MGGFCRQKVPSEVRLLVQIDGKAAKRKFFAHTSDQPGRVRLADATLQVDNRNDGGPGLLCRYHGDSLAQSIIVVEVSFVDGRAVDHGGRNAQQPTPTAWRIDLRIAQTPLCYISCPSATNPFLVWQMCARRCLTSISKRKLLTCGREPPQETRRRKSAAVAMPLGHLGAIRS